MNAKPICAITGSNGYVGGRIAAALAAAGWEIRELVRQPKPGANAVKFQLGADLSPSAFAGAQALVHCAYDFKPLDWTELRALNVAGSEKIFRAARAAGVQKIVFISSISAYDGCRSLYGKAKLEIERAALAHGGWVIRPGLVHGDRPGGMFGKLKQQVSRAAIVPMIGDGSQIQYLVHEDDLCALVNGCVNGQIQTGPKIFTAAHPQPWPFKTLLRAIARGLGKKVIFVPLPWRLVWLGLKSAEACGLKLNFRSDSLLSLMYQNPQPDFSAGAGAGVTYRPFPQVD